MEFVTENGKEYVLISRHAHKNEPVKQITNREKFVYQNRQLSKALYGIAYATFKDDLREDLNTISNTYTFKDGIPNGKFVDYGSKEDRIHISYHLLNIVGILKPKPLRFYLKAE